MRSALLNSIRCRAQFRERRAASQLAVADSRFAPTHPCLRPLPIITDVAKAINFMNLRRSALRIPVRSSAGRLLPGALHALRADSLQAHLRATEAKTWLRNWARPRKLRRPLERSLCCAEAVPHIVKLTAGGVKIRMPGPFRGGVPKRPTGADCKSAGLRLRRFESYPLHHLSDLARGPARPHR